MLIRIIMCIALFAVAVGFLWFMSQVIYLGIKEFFKQKKDFATTTATPATPAAPTVVVAP